MLGNLIKDNQTAREFLARIPQAVTERVMRWNPAGRQYFGLSSYDTVRKMPSRAISSITVPAAVSPGALTTPKRAP